MSLIVLGEAATKVMDQHPAFAELHQQIPWRSMRGMRNWPWFNPPGKPSAWPTHLA